MQMWKCRASRTRITDATAWQISTREAVGGSSRRSTIRIRITSAISGRRVINTNQMNNQERNSLLQPYFEEGEFGGVRYFKRLPLEVLERLIDRGFVEMEPWNECPGMEVFLPFLRRNPLFNAHGYAVSPERPDTRITIEGVEFDGSLSKAKIIDFFMTFRGADDMYIGPDHARCWYD